MNHQSRPPGPDSDDWRARAACRRAPDTSCFFPVRGSNAPLQTATAKAICSACPVIEQCRADAVANNIEFGVFGGTTPHERRALRRAARTRAEASA